MNHLFYGVVPIGFIGFLIYQGYWKFALGIVLFLVLGVIGIDVAENPDLEKMELKKSQTNKKD